MKKIEKSKEGGERRVDKTVSARMPLEFRRTEPEAESAGGDAEPLALGSRVGRYLVERRVAKGGMGIVYVAHDPELDRRVALKWVHRDFVGGEDAQNRLLREARAMARLAHPNVVTVYDLLVHGGHLVLAMELVDGETLGAWLDRTKERSWRKVLPRFVQAGRGLAAAHAVGLVHRDFKPDNVLLSADGRARVTDFGLARTMDGESASVAEPTGAVHTGSDPLATPITRTGAIMGTPAYMAPEQYRGQADARSDQFAFCAALYEALSGELPFEGDTWDELRRAVAEGEAKPLPAKVAPPWLHRLIRRGLRVDPAQRFASMDALLEVLERDRAVRRRWIVAGALVAVSAVVVGFGYREARVRALRVCGGADARLAGVWDAPHREAISAAFTRSTKPYASDAFHGVERALDAYAGAWAAMRTEACEATQVRHDQSAELMDLRMACLAERREELRGVVTLLEHADDALVVRSVAAANSLTGLDRCADVRVLRAQAEPPAGIRERVRELRNEIAKVKSMRVAGRYVDALAACRKLRDEAQAVAHAPLEAEVLTELGDIERLTGDPVAAEATLYRAAWTADAAGDDLHRAWAWTQQLFVVGYVLKKKDAVPLLREQAVAVVKRVPGDPELDAQLEGALANILLDEGKPAEARAAFQREIDIHERMHGKDCPHVYRPLANLALSYAHEHDYASALPVYARAFAVMEKTLGNAHPDLAAVLAHVGGIRDGLEEFTAAEAIYRRALAISEAALGPDNPGISIHLGNLSRALSNQKRFEEAAPLATRSLALREKALGANAAKLIYPLLAVGQAYAGLGDHARVISALERALALPAGGDVLNTRSAVKFILATSLRAVGREPARVVALASEARDELRKSGGDPQERRMLAEVERFLAKK